MRTWGQTLGSDPEGFGLPGYGFCDTIRYCKHMGEARLPQRRDVSEAKIKDTIVALPDVQSCNVEFDSKGSITAVHIVSRSQRAAKQIVRDVESVLLADFGIRVDHRKISVARLERAPQPVSERPPRPRYVSLNLSMSAGRGKCEVVLGRGDVEATGEASGVTAGSGRLRLISNATFRAIEKLVGDQIGFDLLDVVRLSVGGRQSVVVLVCCVSEDDVRYLAGCVQFEHDEQEGTVLATLDACNRIVEKLPQIERTEYEIIPREES